MRSSVEPSGRSVMVRRLGLIARAPRLRKLALTAHVAAPASDAPTACGELHLTRRGCVGIANVGGGHHNVVVVLDAGADALHGRSREQAFDEELAATGARPGAERISTVSATGPFDFPTRSSVTDGALLVGDAAGYYDPFTGQGIYRALRGAELAVPVILRAIASGDTSARALRPYHRAQRRAFAPGERVLVIDPGPVDEAHLAAIAAAGPVTAILLTHAHADHAAGAARLREMTGASILMGRGAIATLPAAVDRWLEDGDRLEVDVGEAVAVHTPGHVPEHMCVHWRGDGAPPGGALFAGDLLMGSGDTTLIAPPEGDVGAYLRSLDRVEALEVGVIHPAHGPLRRRDQRGIARPHQ